jgi:hypothetical protein
MDRPDRIEPEADKEEEEDVGESDHGELQRQCAPGDLRPSDADVGDVEDVASDPRDPQQRDGPQPDDPNTHPSDPEPGTSSRSASQGASAADLARLERQLAVLNERIADARTHKAVREERLRKECADLERDIGMLIPHIRTLDRFTRKLSLLHSQLAAASNYKLAKPDVDEIVRLVGDL